MRENILLIEPSMPTDPDTDSTELADIRVPPRAVRMAVIEGIASWPEEWAERWAQRIISSNLPAYLDPQIVAECVRGTRSVLDYIGKNPGAEFNRSVLSARLLGDSHALRRGPQKDFISQALRWHIGRQELRGRRLWEAAGIWNDRVSDPALAWMLPATGASPLAEQVRAANKGGVPAYLGRYSLNRYPVEVSPGTRVLVVENPSLVEMAIERESPACVIATGGFPSGAVLSLLRQLVESGACIWFHTDFDRGGFKVGRRLHKIGGRPWRMAHLDYLRAIRLARRRGVSLPVDTKPGTCGDTTWDRNLRRAYENARVIVHEEVLVDSILEFDVSEG